VQAADFLSKGGPAGKMKTLIVYMSSHGCTERAAGLLGGKLPGETIQVNLKKDRVPHLGDFDAIIVGGSIHAGRIQGKVRKFCKKNMDRLLQKKLGLFICCMEQGESAKRQFEEAFPEELRNHASASGFFGGEFDFDKMNFFQRKIVKKVAGIEESVSRFNGEAVAAFAEKIGL